MAKKESDDKKHLFLRGNVWWIQAMRDGQRIVQSTNTSDLEKAQEERDRVLNPFNLKNKKDRAEAVLASVQTVDQQIAKAEDSLPALKVRQTWDAFMKSPERSDASERTLNGYMSQWNRFENWIEKRRENGELRAVTTQDAGDYAIDLVSAGITPNTFNKHIVLLEMLFRVLSDKARIGSNPWIKIKRKRLTTQGRRALTVAELQTVLEKATGELQTLLIIGAYSGLRLGDAVTLDWSSVDLARGIITLRPRKTASRTGKIVAIPLHHTLHAALSQTPATDRKGAVLPELAKMREENPDGINYRLQRHFIACGIKTTVERDGAGRQVPVAGFHALRHTIVSQLASKGVPLETIRGLVGHGGESMTRAYVHQNAEAARAAVGALQAMGAAQTKGATKDELEALQKTLDRMTPEQLKTLAKQVSAAIKKNKTAENPKQVAAGK